MKTITISFPTNLREIKKVTTDHLKKALYSKKWNNNNEVFLKMEKDICDIINSGYWALDISDRMQYRLTDSQHGDIPRIIRNAFKKIK